MIVRTPDPSSRRLFTRRASLHLAAGGLLLPSFVGTARAAADTGEVHGLSIFGDLQLPKDFPHLPYADPTAPKGGEVRLQMTSSSGNQNLYTFNTLNIFNQPGNGAAGVSASFDSLMTATATSRTRSMASSRAASSSRRTGSPIAFSCGRRRASSTARR